MGSKQSTLLKTRWTPARTDAVVRAMAAGEDWTQHLVLGPDGGTLPLLESSGLTVLPNQAGPRDLRGISIDTLNIKDPSCFADCALDYASLTGIVASDSSFRGSSLNNARITDCVMKGASFEFAVLKRATILRTNMRRANLANADISEASFLESDLAGASVATVRFSYEGPLSFVRLGPRSTSIRIPRRSAGRLRGMSMRLEEHLRGERTAQRLEAENGAIAALAYGLTDYGRSPARLLVWALFTWMMFALAFWRLDPVGPEGFVTRAGADITLGESFYLSGMVLVGTWGGDIVPSGSAGLLRGLLGVEALMGFIFLGAALSLVVHGVVGD